jgi:hypothetical protein
MFALIDQHGRVCEFFEQDPGPWPKPQRIVDVSHIDGIAENWTMDDEGGFHAPPDPPPVDLTAYAADVRWRKEVGGITLGGVPMATDDRSKIMIMGARVAAAANSGWETVWHGADGASYPLNAAQMIAISDAVEAHVNATFAVFSGVKADIDAGDITTPEEIESAFGF